MRWSRVACWLASNFFLGSGGFASFASLLSNASSFTSDAVDDATETGYSLIECFLSDMLDKSQWGGVWLFIVVTARQLWGMV